MLEAGMVAMFGKSYWWQGVFYNVVLILSCMKFVDPEAPSKRREVGKYNAHVAFLSIKNGAKLRNYTLY
jgi:hypothetical protein